jgi:amino acid adenylation domain-containing protein
LRENWQPSTLRIEQFLRNGAGQHPDRPALVSGGVRLTYAALDRQSDRLAAGLLDLGVQRGDRVLIQLENGIEAVLAIFAALKVGATFVPLNPSVKAEKLAFIANDCRAAALVIDSRWRETAADAVCRMTRSPAVVFVGGEPKAEEYQPSGAVAFEDVLRTPANHRESGIDIDLGALIYTSGSTGTPKGVMLTHLNIVSACRSIIGYLQNTSDDVIVDVLPLSFDYGLYQVFMSVMVGARIVLERSFAYPPAVLETIVREGVTGFPIVPTIAALLLKHDLGNYDLSSLRYMTNTGAVLPPAHIGELRRRLPHVRLFSMYGLTECKRVSYLDPAELDNRPTSVGKAMDNVEVFLIDEAGTRQDRGVGQLVVRGSNVMQGYWGLPEETDRVLKSGALPGEKLLLTGDQFRIDDDGYLYFIGRTDDIIKCRGEKVSPKEIENVVHALPGVRQAAVIGVDDPVLGQAVKVFVLADADVTLTEVDVLRHCARHLEDSMMPKFVEFVDCMPYTSSGKIDRRHLASGPKTSAVQVDA